MEVTTEVEVECEECRQTLNAKFVCGTGIRASNTARVEPCTKCLLAKYDEGLEEQREGRDKEVTELRGEIETLESKVAELEEQLERIHEERGGE